MRKHMWMNKLQNISNETFVNYAYNFIYLYEMFKQLQVVLQITFEHLSVYLSKNTENNLSYRVCKINARKKLAVCKEDEKMVFNLIIIFVYNV